MNNRRKICAIFGTIWLWLISLFGMALPAVAASSWSYQEEKYELYEPQFSPDNNYLVFVHNLHFPDGHEAELFSEKDLQALHDWANKNERTEEPEVVLIKLADKSTLVISATT